MSDAFYIDIRDNTVIPLLAEYGQPYNVVIGGKQDPATLTVSPPSLHPVMGLISDGQFVNSLVQPEGAGKQWLSNRMLLLIPDPIVEQASSVLIDGKEHDLKSVKRIQPAAVNVLYILDLEA